MEVGTWSSIGQRLNAKPNEASWTIEAEPYTFSSWSTSSQLSGFVQTAILLLADGVAV